MAAAVPVGSSGAVAVPGLQVIAAISACPPARPPEAISAALILRRSIVRREHFARASKAIHTAAYARGSCSLVATDPDGADRRAGLIHDADGPFGVRPETAVQVFQPLAHENHGSIAGRLRARKLGAGMVGLVRPVVEVEEVASHGPGNAVRSRIVAEHPDADLASRSASISASVLNRNSDSSIGLTSAAVHG